MIQFWDAVVTGIGAIIAVAATITTGVAVGALIYGMVMDAVAVTGLASPQAHQYLHGGRYRRTTTTGKLMYAGRVVNTLLLVIGVLYVIGRVLLAIGVGA